MELIQGDLLKPFMTRFQHQVDLLVCLWSIQLDAVPHMHILQRGKCLHHVIKTTDTA